MSAANPYQAPAANLEADPHAISRQATVSAKVLQHLAETRPWVRIIGALLFVAIVVMVLGGVGGLIGALVTDSSGFAEIGALAGLYLFMALIYIPPWLYLRRYADAIRRLSSTGQVAVLEEALMHQQMFWRFCGFLAIVGLVLGVIGVGAGFVVGSIFGR